MYTSTRRSFDETTDISNPLALLNYLARKDFMEMFSNLAIALRILVDRTVERSFSILKWIKNYLRNNMADSRLSHLALISIEEDCLNDVSQDDVISRFVP